VLIHNWESFLGKLSIPVTEDRLLEIYQSVLTERGVTDYPLESSAGMTTGWRCCDQPATWPPLSAKRFRPQHLGTQLRRPGRTPALDQKSRISRFQGQLCVR
jgi:hypothetical protein